MSKITVSVIIPTLNSAETLEKCLTSIRKNNSKYKYEIIVADAGSRDRTREIAKKYADKVLEGVPNRINRNIGIQNTDAEIICFTDSDCVVSKDWIDGLVDGLLRLSKKNNKVVGVGGGNIPLLKNPSFMELVITKAIRSPLVSFGARNVTLYRDEREVKHNPPMNSAYFKWAIESVKGFQEEYGYGGEDLELDAKLIDKGYKLYYLPRVLVRHIHRSNLREFAKQMYKFGMGKIRVGRKFKKYLPFYHYGPLFLCLMIFSPLIFIPIGMGLMNATYVSLRERSVLIFLPIVLLTMIFYISYGLGEIVQTVRRKK